jgi:hypothetical protein
MLRRADEVRLRATVVTVLVLALAACATSGIHGWRTLGGAPLQARLVLESLPPSDHVWLVRVPREKAEGHLRYAHVSGQLDNDAFEYIAVRRSCPTLQTAVATLDTRGAQALLCVGNPQLHATDEGGIGRTFDVCAPLRTP